MDINTATPVFSMIVCICNAISDSQIQDAVDQGHTSLDAVRDELGVANTCGTCACEAERVVQAKLNSSLASQVQLTGVTPRARQIFL